MKVQFIHSTFCISTLGTTIITCQLVKQSGDHSLSELVTGGALSRKAFISLFTSVHKKPIFSGFEIPLSLLCYP